MIGSVVYKKKNKNQNIIGRKVSNNSLMVVNTL